MHSASVGCERAPVPAAHARLLLGFPRDAARRPARVRRPGDVRAHRGTGAIAGAIAIDGSDANWAGIPSIADPTGDAGGFADRDITSVSIAPLEDALLVRIATAAPPVSDDLAYWLEIDYRGAMQLDLQIGLYPGSDDILWTYPEDAEPAFQYWSDSQLAVGGVVEARIPYAALAAALPPAMASDLSGAGARGWVRVWAFSEHPTTFARLDQVVMGSYRLAPTPFPLDPPRPAVAGPAVEMGMPLEGPWIIGQGPLTQGSHVDAWAWDLNRVDAELHESNPDPAWRTPSTTRSARPCTHRSPDPCASRGHRADQPPRTVPPPGALANLVQIDAPGNRSVSLYHLRQGSVPVSTAANALEGQLVGQVGNSVNSYSWPHLHLQAESPAGGTALQPIALREVEVQLNPATPMPGSAGSRAGSLARACSCSPRSRAVRRPRYGSRARRRRCRALPRVPRRRRVALARGQRALQRDRQRAAVRAARLGRGPAPARGPPRAPAIAQVCSAAVGSTP